MVKPHLVLISELEEDTRVFSAVARSLKFSFSQVADRDSLRVILQAFPASIVIWSAEHEEPVGEKGMGQAPSIRETLHKLISPSHVFALSDKPASRNPELFDKNPFFQHYILRRYKDPAQEIILRLMVAAMTPGPFGLKRFFPSNTASQVVTLKKARQRLVAVQAIEKVFLRKGIKPRLAARVAQATDELLMNALFNAPHNGLGNPTRRLVPRSEDFDLGKNELVQMEIISNEEYVGICVTDQFGTLERDLVMRLLGKSYRSGAYTPKDNQPGAGLGLYGIIEMGFSLVFVVKPGVRTDAMILFPLGGGSYKNFREGFQFVAYFGGIAFKKTPT